MTEDFQLIGHDHLAWHACTQNNQQDT